MSPLTSWVRRIDRWCGGSCSWTGPRQASRTVRVVYITAEGDTAVGLGLDVEDDRLVRFHADRATGRRLAERLDAGPVTVTVARRRRR